MDKLFLFHYLVLVGFLSLKYDYCLLAFNWEAGGKGRSVGEFPWLVSIEPQRLVFSSVVVCVRMRRENFAQLSQLSWPAWTEIAAWRAVCVLSNNSARPLCNSNSKIQLSAYTQAEPTSFALEPCAACVSIAESFSLMLFCKN